MKENLLIKSIVFIFNEYKNHKVSILNIAKENMRQQTLRTSLGIGWVVIRDFVYFAVFIVFRLLMAGSGTIEGMNFILFLMLGMIPWNFMNECINGGIMAIKNNKSLLSSMYFPIVILPTIEILSIFMKRLFTLLIMLLAIIVFGDIKDINLILFFYYFVSMFVFMTLWNLIFSSLVAISNDFEQLYRSFTSILFYTMPVIWSFETFGSNSLLIQLFKLNPFVYIIEGFRDACVTGTLPDLEYTIYFWIVSIFLFFIGCILQFKLKNHYIDLI